MTAYHVPTQPANPAPAKRKPLEPTKRRLLMGASVLALVAVCNAAAAVAPAEAFTCDSVTNPAAGNAGATDGGGTTNTACGSNANAGGGGLANSAYGANANASGTLSANSAVGFAPMRRATTAQIRPLGLSPTRAATTAATRRSATMPTPPATTVSTRHLARSLTPGAESFNTAVGNNANASGGVATNGSDNVAMAISPMPPATAARILPAAPLPVP